MRTKGSISAGRVGQSDLKINFDLFNFVKTRAETERGICTNSQQNTTRIKGRNQDFLDLSWNRCPDFEQMSNYII